MAIGDFFKAKENNQLKARVAELESMLTPEMQDSLKLRELITAQQQELAQLKELSQKEETRYNAQVDKDQKELSSLQQQISAAKQELIETDEEVLMQSFGMYKPHYAFANSTRYKEELADLRAKQKDWIKRGLAATGSDTWTVNGDARKGKKMIADMQKLLIRAFNFECDDAIDHVKFNNIDTSKKRIESSFNAISKLGAICSVAITETYKNMKIRELYLAYEYQVEKQKEKDALKQLRAEERERAKLEREITEARKKIEKEQKHFSNALLKINQQIANANADELPALEAKKAELESQLSDLGESMKKIDYREANQKAGYVYIISNVGAFGEGIYKIGMTRRLEPMDRVDELGDASVPFDFDVHALIFSDNAPALEAALHRAFEDRKLNMVNTRREFFRVSLDEIKAVVKENFDKTVDFIDIPPAEQYRQSELLRSNK